MFAELAAKFQRLVDALNDVSEMSWRSSDRDVLRLYEVWLRTGSPRAHALLRELGVSPAVVPVGPRAELTAVLLRELQEPARRAVRRPGGARRRTIS